MSKTILLVEDNHDDLELTLRVLDKCCAQHAVVIARDGAEALDLLLENGGHQSGDLPTPPRLILLDLKLPKLNGLEVLRHLRGHVRTKNIPVVIFTSSNEEQDVLSAYRLGANSYVCKPVDYRQFCDALQQITDYWLGVNQPPTDVLLGDDRSPPLLSGTAR